MTRSSRQTPAAAKSPLRRVLPHHRMLICATLGTVVAVAWPEVSTLLSRGLIAWNVLAWTYLAWVGALLLRADDGHMKRVALAQADSAPAVFAFVVAGALMSLAAIVFELAAAKAAGPHHMLVHGLAAFVTVAGSWLLVPIVFALTYAASYYRREPDGGLIFPGAPESFEPGHTDFLYFSLTIAVTAQTSDVSVSTREMRKLVLAQSVLAFVFNTTILAFSINAAISFL